MIGVIVSAIVYGGVLSLTLSYGSLLLKTSYDISRRMRKFLLVYVTFMVAMSTVYIIATIIALRNNLFGGLGGTAMPVIPSCQNEFPGTLTALCIMFTSWGADGFMVRNFQKNLREIHLDRFSFPVRNIALAVCDVI